MKKIAMLMTMLVLAMALNTMPAFAKNARKGAEFIPFANTAPPLPSGWGLLPSPSAYINVYDPDACGKVILNQPEGEVSVTITGIVHGLPEGTYYAYLWGSISVSG